MIEPTAPALCPGRCGQPLTGIGYRWPPQEEPDPRQQGRTVAKWETANPTEIAAGLARCGVCSGHDWRELQQARVEATRIANRNFPGLTRPPRAVQPIRGRDFGATGRDPTLARVLGRAARTEAQARQRERRPAQEADW